jgi:hypothetical protein
LNCYAATQFFEIQRLYQLISYFMFDTVIQINIRRCHSDGCDTRIRGVNAVGYRLVRNWQVYLALKERLWQQPHDSTLSQSTATVKGSERANPNPPCQHILWEVTGGKPRLSVELFSQVSWVRNENRTRHFRSEPHLLWW